MPKIVAATIPKPHQETADTSTLIAQKTKDSEMPSVLAEVSLINDPEEEVRLTQATYRGEIAHQLALGLEDYIAAIDDAVEAALSGR